MAYVAFAAAPAFAQDELPAGHEGETAAEHAAHSHGDEHDNHIGHEELVHAEHGDHHITLDQPGVTPVSSSHA